MLAIFKTLVSNLSDATFVFKMYLEEKKREIQEARTPMYMYQFLHREQGHAPGNLGSHYQQDVFE